MKSILKTSTAEYFTTTAGRKFLIGQREIVFDEKISASDAEYAHQHKFHGIVKKDDTDQVVKPESEQAKEADKTTDNAPTGLAEETADDGDAASGGKGKKNPAKN